MWVFIYFVSASESTLENENMFQKGPDLHASREQQRMQLLGWARCMSYDKLSSCLLFAFAGRCCTQSVPADA